jgi:hypothetical protein
MSFNYDDLVNKSYFIENNFSGRFSITNLNNNMIQCSNLEEFHYQTSFFLNLYSSLFIELKVKEKEFGYNITSFSDLINNLKIIISDSINSKLSEITNNNFIFYYKTFEKFDGKNELLSDLYSTAISKPFSSFSNNLDIINIAKPNLGNYPTFLMKKNYFQNFGNIFNKEFNKNNIDRFIFKNNKLKEIIKNILTQTPENLIGFILYQKIFYNTILYNIDIQNSIRRNYINNNNLDLNISPDKNNDLINIINLIKEKIDDNISNLKKISKDTFSVNDFLVEKNKYKNKINAFNILREEFSKTLDKLNLSIKLYNYELSNYKKIKNYATYIIIFLIIIMIFIISVSIFPIFNNNTKNAIYIIIFIVLLIITYIYYMNFKYIVLYEKFTNTTELENNKTIISFSNCSTFIRFLNNNIVRLNHASFYNNLLPKINEYSNSVNDLFNDLRMNVLTIGSKSFSQDANIIIYNVYLEKKRQLENNNIKLTNLFNMIEIIKKQISYLFNFVFIIACLCLILLLGLVLYSSVPQLFIYIIILCIVLITILMIYFAFTIIQPTRMIANKNYWAIANPSKNNIGKL